MISLEEEISVHLFNSWYMSLYSLPFYNQVDQKLYYEFGDVHRLLQNKLLDDKWR